MLNLTNNYPGGGTGCDGIDVSVSGEFAIGINVTATNPYVGFGVWGKYNPGAGGSAFSEGYGIYGTAAAARGISVAGLIDNGNDKAGQGSNGISGVKATDLSPSGAYTYGLNASSLYNTAVYGTSGYGITAQFYNGASGAGTCTYSGGPGWSCTSDRNLKQDFTRVDSTELLERLDAMPISEYSMKGAQDAARYFGPTAQDFAAAFHLGEGDTTINTANAQGVALAAAKDLYESVKADEGKLAEQAEIISALTGRLAALEQKFETEASLRRAGAEPALAIKTALEQPPL